MKTIALLFSLAFSFIGMTQTTWYVSTSGQDINSGLSLGNAFATINKAIQSASCGDSIYVIAGTYNEKINAYTICPENNRIILQGDVVNRPTVIGDAAASNRYAFGANGAGFHVRHFNFQSPFPLDCDQSNMVLVGSGDHFRFEDIIIENGGYDGVKTTSDCSISDWATDWELIDCIIQNNGLGCPSAVLNGDGVDFTTCHDCLIEGTTIKDNKGHQLQIKLQAKNVSVVRSHIEGKNLIQVGLEGATPQCDPLEPNADSVFFYNNVIFAKGDTSDWVFKLADVTHLYLENNTIVKDSITAVNVGFICFGGCGSGANWLETPQSPVVIKNTIFADFSSIPFYAGVSATFFDPYSIVQTEVQSSFNLFYDALGQLVVPADSSLNSIVANPLFCDYPSTVYLHQNSPCINSGDPSSPFDPYNTQNDIGAFYFQQNCNLDVFDNQLNELTIYPNPVKDYCTLVSTDELLHEIEIINALGKKVEALQFKQEIQLDFSNFQTGVYFIIDRSNFKRYRIVKI